MNTNAKNAKDENVEFINKENSRYKGFNFNYIKNRKVYAIISCIVLLAGLASFLIRGFNWDIDFLGGTVIQYNLRKDLTAADQQRVESIVRDVTGQSSTVQIMELQQISIKTLELETSERDEMFKAMAAEYNLTEEDILRIESIDPTVGKALTESTVTSVLVAIFLMLVYISIRFDLLSGFATILCLSFDMFVVLTFYSLLQIPMNTVVIAAFLTILGYSINATIITFDRVRENVKIKKSSMTFGDIINLSTNQTLLRSINTTITTLLTLIAIYVLGVSSIRNFVLPLIIGIGSGLFSSICLSGGLWDFFKSMRDKSKAKKATKNTVKTKA